MNEANRAKLDEANAKIREAAARSAVAEANAARAGFIGHADRAEKAAAAARSALSAARAAPTAPTPTPPVAAVQIGHGRMCWNGVALTAAERDALVSAGALAPTPKLFGLRLAVRRDAPRGGASNKDNQPATFLMIDPKNGIAPPPWQRRVGPCTVARVDGCAFTADDYSIVHDYLCALLDAWGDGRPPTAKLTVQGFQRHVHAEHARSSGARGANLLLPRVRLQGLSKASLNGRHGFRGPLHAAKGRYPVYLDNGKSVLVKPANVHGGGDAGGDFSGAFGKGTKGYDFGKPFGGGGSDGGSGSGASASSSSGSSNKSELQRLLDEGKAWTAIAGAVDRGVAAFGAAVNRAVDTCGGACVAKMRDAYQVTALHYAAFLGDTQSAGLLLAWGADPLARNALGETPMGNAEAGGHEKCARVMASMVGNSSVAQGNGRILQGVEQKEQSVEFMDLDLHLEGDAPKASAAKRP